MATEILVKNIRGLETAWLGAGRRGAPIMLCLHGYPDTPEAWNFQMEHFREKFRVLAPHVRGGRPSEKSSRLARYGLEAECLDILSILKEEDPQQRAQVIILGHDLGGVLAWRLAPLLGPRLKGLVIINSLSLEQARARLTNRRSQLQKSSYMIPFMLYGESLVKKNPAKLLQIAHKKGGLEPALQPPLATALLGVVNPIRRYRAYAWSYLRHFTEKPVRVKSPVLVLWGEQDAFLDTITADEMDLMASHYTVRILNGNHWIHREQSVVVNQLLDDFICNLPLA